MMKNNEKRNGTQGKKRRKLTALKVIGILFLLLVLALAGFAAWLWFPVKDKAPDYVEKMYLPKNEFSRPAKKLPEVNSIVIHYVANPGTSAEANRNYFRNLAIPKANPAGTKASSHFIIGLQGEIVQCIPLTEIAYANYPRNYDTISIEVCHPDETGRFNDETYASVVKLTADLLKSYGLTADDVIRHHDVSGKNCPKYYVENEEAWAQLKADIAAALAALE